jgi:2-iminobutanoate/2-iminopropanoate deaminase
MKETNGHYSAGVISGGHLFVSGQLPIDPQTGKIISGGIKEQAIRSLSNLESVLAQAGLSKDHVVKTTVYISDIALWPEANQAYADFFEGHKPARSIVPTGPLHYGALVEVEAVAEYPERKNLNTNH